MKPKFCTAFLIVGLSAAGCFLVLPLSPLAQGVVFVAVNASAVGATAVGMAVHRPSKPGHWAALLVGQVLYLVGFVVWYPYPLATGTELPYPSVADALFLASYGLFAVALVLLVRARSPQRKRADLIDASIIALGLGVLSWLFLIDPVVEASDVSLLAKAVSVAYPLVDIVLVALAVRMAVAPGDRTPAFWLLMLWITVQLGTDAAFARTALDGTFRLGGIVTFSWLASMVVLGSAALHPSMRTLAAPGAARRAAPLGRRLPLLAGAALIPLGLLAVQAARGEEPDVVVVASVSSVIFLLVLKRISDLMVDVAEHERVQAQLRQLASIVECSDDAISSWTTDGVVTSWNGGASRLFGYTPEEIVGHPFSLLIPPEGRSEANAMLERIPAGEPVPPFETSLLRKDGSVVEVSVTVAPVRDGSGTVIGGAVIARDMTERRRADEALRTSENRNRSILDTARDAFVGMGDTGLITDWNRSAEVIFGWTRQEAIGRSLAETIVPPRYRESHTSGLQRFFESGEGPVLDTRIEISAVNRDGQEFPVELLVWATGVGDQQYFSAFIQDITERKRTEEALAMARDQAMAASRSKSEFIANMSHEIRTPMNGVIGLTGLLLDTPLDATQRRFAEGVRSAGESLLAVINNVLDFSKIEAGKMEIEAVDFPLHRAVEEAVGMMAQTARNKRVELIGYCQPDVPVVLRGDEGRLRQVLLNLVSNAVKFTENGEVVVQARLIEQNADAVVVRFDVIDTGIGIDAEHRMRLFQPFTQADASTTRRYGGTGLGLAISKQLIEAMGGSIGVDSEVGRGSTFWFTIPLQRALNPDLEVLPHSDVLEGARALVVDDNETNRLVLVAQLAVWGMQAEAVEDGAAALRRLRMAARRDSPYAVALLDLCMEAMDGLELARHITADPALVSTRLLLLTSGSEIDAQSAREAGIRARLTKPVRNSELHDALVGALAPSQPSPAPPARAEVGEVATMARGVVLVAEDNELNQMVAKGIVSKLGFHCDVVINGLEAVEAVEHNVYTAVLMDCHMPTMDGFDATREIRRRESGERHTPIIAMTAGATLEDRDRCLAAGMDDYIAKPVARKDVEAALSLWLAEDDPATAGARVGRGVDTSGVLDPERLAALKTIEPEDDTRFVATLANSFLTKTPVDLEALKIAVAADNAMEVKDIAHRLKGAASNLGATAMASGLAELEALGRDGDLEHASALITRLQLELSRVGDALHVLLPREDAG